jgi:hypothetical protein
MKERIRQDLQGGEDIFSLSGRKVKHRRVWEQILNFRENGIGFHSFIRKE